MSFFSILDHPADLAITYQAPDLPGVYQLAAAALFELMYGAKEASSEVFTTQEVVTRG